MKALAYYDGKIGAPEELTVPFYDRAHFFGDGCYDAAMAANGTIFLLEDHLDRFYTSARLLDIHIPMEKQALGELLTQLARQVEGESCFVYWQVSRGVEPRSHIYAENLPGKLWVLVRPQVIPNPNIPIRLNDEEDTRFFHCNIKSLNLLCNVMTAQRRTAPGARRPCSTGGDRHRMRPLQHFRPEGRSSVLPSQRRVHPPGHCQEPHDPGLLPAGYPRAGKALHDGFFEIRR